MMHHSSRYFCINNNHYVPMMVRFVLLVYCWSMMLMFHVMSNHHYHRQGTINNNIHVTGFQIIPTLYYYYTRYKSYNNHYNINHHSSKHIIYHSQQICLQSHNEQQQHDVVVTDQYNSNDEDDRIYDSDSDNHESSKSKSSSSLFIQQTFQERYHEYIPSWLLQRCYDCGYIYPTYIQANVLDTIYQIPVQHSSSSTTTMNHTNHTTTTTTTTNQNHQKNQNTNQNYIIQSATGSGKTLAYLLPCLSNIDRTRSSLQAFIIVPTRELGIQITKLMKRLSVIPNIITDITTTTNTTSSPSLQTNNKKLMIMSLLQGSYNRRQYAWVYAQPPHIIIGTPYEIYTMIHQHKIKRYHTIKYVIVDEVDACLLYQPSQSQSSSSTTTTMTTGTPLQELLSKYLSPTYDDGKTSIHDEYDSTTTTSNTHQYQQQYQYHRPNISSRTTIFCSATIPQHRYFMKQCIQNQWMNQTPIYITAQQQSSSSLSKQQQSSSLRSIPSQESTIIPSQIKHGYIVTSNMEKKFIVLRRLLKKIMVQQIQNQNNNNNTKRILIFCDPQRPIEQMANSITKDLQNIYEQYNNKNQNNHNQVETTNQSKQYSNNNNTTTSISNTKNNFIVAVLRYEDNLSQRANAMNALRGDPILSYQYQNRYMRWYPNNNNTNNNKQKVYTLNANNQSNEDDYSDDYDDDEEYEEEYDDDDNFDQDDMTSILSSPTVNSSSSTDISLRILLSTDLVARGIDIMDISHVIIFDIQDTANMYIHRAGRTGRLHHMGHVISIMTQEQEFVYHRIMNQLCIYNPTCIGRQ